MIRSFQKSALSKANNYFDRGAYSCKNDEKSLIYRMETESKNMSSKPTTNTHALYNVQHLLVLFKFISSRN